MNLKQDLLDIGKGKITQAKAFLEELEVQMALGKAEARDAFEQEKKNLSTYLRKQKAQLRETEHIAENHKADLLKSFEILEGQLGKELPITKRKFDKLKKETLNKIYRLEAELKNTYGEVSSSLQKELDDFKIKLDGYRVQLALGTIEDETALAKRKTELQQQVDEIRLKLQKETAAGDRVDHFVDEISKSFNHMKKAFADLFE